MTNGGRKILKPALIPQERIESKIYLIRRKRVMLDRDVAKLYGVETRVLLQAVRRNIGRFPEDFLFKLNEQELENWRSQIVMSNPSEKMGLRRFPYAFTEHGAIMAASVLRSRRAIEISIYVVRAFVKLREALPAHREIARKLSELEKKVISHDKDIRALFDAIRKLMPLPSDKKRIGFVP